MAAGAVNRISLITAGALTLIAVVAGAVYLNKPANEPGKNAAATVEAKSYLHNLALSEVNMQATENFMKQQVVEVAGNISNNGQRKLAEIDVYCLFTGVNGAEIHRERLPIVKSGAGVAVMAPGETRAFRLPFDELPEGWNQAMPRLVIAQIRFAE